MSTLENDVHNLELKCESLKIAITKKDREIGNSNI